MAADPRLLGLPVLSGTAPPKLLLLLRCSFRQTRAVQRPADFVGGGRKTLEEDSQKEGLILQKALCRSGRESCRIQNRQCSVSPHGHIFHPFPRCPAVHGPPMPGPFPPVGISAPDEDAQCLWPRTSSDSRKSAVPEMENEESSRRSQAQK